MNVDDLSPEHRRAYYRQCAGPHTVETSVALENMDGEELVSFDGGRGGGRDVTVQGGDIQVDADTPTGRVLTLPVADPGHELMTAEAANYVDRQLHVKSGVPVPDIGKTIWRTTFQGPIISAPRAGDVVQFTAHGQARYGMHGIRELVIYPKGMPVTTAIKRILIDLCGETMSRLGDIPDLEVKLQAAYPLHIQSQPWVKAQELATGITRHLHYSGDADRGMKPAMTRTDSTHVAYKFTSAFDQPGMVAGPPEVSTDILGTLKNAVRVTGGTPKTGKAPIGYAFADGDFSPGKLGRGASEAYFWHLVTIKTLHTQEAVDREAANILARDMVGNRDAKWDSMPFYAFDEYDLLEIDTNELSTRAYWRQGTIPLDINGAPTMPYGYNGRRVHRPFAGRR